MRYAFVLLGKVSGTKIMQSSVSNYWVKLMLTQEQKMEAFSKNTD